MNCKKCGEYLVTPTEPCPNCGELNIDNQNETNEAIKPIIEENKETDNIEENTYIDLIPKEEIKPLEPVQNIESEKEIPKVVNNEPLTKKKVGLILLTIVFVLGSIGFIILVLKSDFLFNKSKKIEDKSSSTTQTNEEKMNSTTKVTEEKNNSISKSTEEKKETSKKTTEEKSSSSTKTSEEKTNSTTQTTEDETSSSSTSSEEFNFDFNFDAEEFYRNNSKIISIIDASKEKNVYTESEVVKLLKNRGFTNGALYDSDMKGNHFESKSIDNPTNTKHPMYTSYYQASNEEVWIVYVIGKDIMAYPTETSMNSAVSIILSEKETIRGYDFYSNRFFVVKPFKEYADVRVVKKIDSTTLDNYSSN